MLASALVVATPAGQGCRAEGPHGPRPCAPLLDPVTGEPLDAEACSCGCSADEDCCDTYFTWHATRLAGGVA
jgi:hypothetical protein